MTPKDVATVTKISNFGLNMFWHRGGLQVLENQVLTRGFLL